MPSPQSAPSAAPQAGRAGRSHLRRSSLAVLLGAALLTLLIGTGAQLAGALDPPASDIDITVVSAPGSALCLSPASAATATVFITELTYTVTIRAHAPICQPVTAVIYSMPANFFWPWPQHRLESKTLTIEPGVTTIVFTRGCAPTQFDVITGAAPISIQPGTGPLLGPLLFNIPWTGIQNWNGPCVGGTSSTASTVATSSTTTTAPQGELPASTTVPSTSSTTTTEPTTTTTTTVAGTPVGVEAIAVVSTPPSTSTTVVGSLVLGATKTRSGVDATAARPVAVAADLAATGTTSWPFELAGSSLLLVGVALNVVVRRRRV